METPALLLSTRKGLPNFISPDLLPSLPSPDSHLFQFSPLHFIEGPSSKTISSIGGLQHLLGLHEYEFAAVARDSVRCLPKCDATKKFGTSFETTRGRRLIRPVAYIEMIPCMKPDIWASLADEVPSWVSDKRNKTSVDRTVKWLDLNSARCLMLRNTGGAVFGAIVGGNDVEERQRCAAEVVNSYVSGYWIGGFGLGESTDERPALLDAVTDVLPEAMPRMICGLGLPDRTLIII